MNVKRMTAEEFRQAGLLLFGPERGWQTRLADALGTDRASISRYLSGLIPVPGPVTAAMRSWMGPDVFNLELDVRKPFEIGIVMAKQELTTTSAQMVVASGADALLTQVRPEWQAKDLIKRVQKLLPVDPSSACQRLLNAAIHDLRSKIIIAGLDVAKEAASRNKLPSIAKTEDVLEYSTTNTIDLTYYMGLLTRSEWRRLKRAYDIRKDLEHEDDEYEAGVEDCVYVFKTCIEIVLSRDPVSPVKVTDIKEIIEEPKKVSLDIEIVDDFGKAPDPRQIEIIQFLISTARNSTQPDIVRQNAVESLRRLDEATRKSVRAAVGQHLQEKLKGQPIEMADMKVAAAAGIVPYLKQTRVSEFFEKALQTLQKIGYRWTSFDQHQKILDDLEDCGGLAAMPAKARAGIVLWMVRCYIGEPGGYGMGINRKVFFSNAAAPRIERLFKDAAELIDEELKAAAKDKVVAAAITDKHIARRMEVLRDIVGVEGEA